MELRFHYAKHPAFKAMLAVQQTIELADQALAELLKVRVSQINGCAYCLKMHTADARKAGVTGQQLDVLAAWHEAGDVFDARTRAALGWAESVTRVSETHASDEAYVELRHHFNEEETAALTWGIVAINAWNRMAIAARTPLDDK